MNRHPSRRAALFAFTALTTLLGAAAMTHILSAGGLHVLEIAMIVVFVPMFGLIALFFWTAVVGTALIVRSRLEGTPIDLMVTPFGALESPLGPDDSCAITIPIYNEDAERVFAGIDAMLRSLDRQPEGDRFDLFVLSDTTDPAVAEREEALYLDLVNSRACRRHSLVYRRRPVNTRRKVGNIEEFCARWGDHYKWMIVLDADSVMDGAVMVRLARLMAANPKTGLIQTLPSPIGGETVFTRSLQFLFSLCSPMLTVGAAWWQGPDANYWGHNAIIRLDAFRRHCRLPELSGPPPLGGEILSHDYVEAALLRCAGYQVWMLPCPAGSYESLPPNLIAYATRDRRWCQGNIQHLRLLSLPGLTLMSRLHFILGAFAYVSSALWAILLLLGSLDAAYLETVGPDFFPKPNGLYPVWPVDRSAEALALFATTMAMLLAPKLLGACLALTSRTLRHGFGGVRRLLAGLVIEIVLAVLTAPVLMALHLRFVVTILAGRTVSWSPQTRNGNGPSARAALAALASTTALGVGALLLLQAWAPDNLLWMAPVLVGLIVSAPLTYLTGRVDLGHAARRWGLFTTPAETAPPEVVAAALGDETEPAPAVLELRRAA